MVAYPNPPADEIHFAYAESGERQLGDQRQAALVAQVKPGTIQVWVSRKKIEPVFTGPEGPIFHLPTVKQAAEGGASHRHPTPWLNSRGPHAHAA
ncbi:hypothetical protein [Streptomyces sp. TUS-ST3]|uniref:hypothetical protein n=1 Tax=Streptomyces sp. TUS-ST3 TaxID=3025591 RepID=UPI0024E1275F|nr:hypothetical protein [Streptomyces sp. TUS-ST3]